MFQELIRQMNDRERAFLQEVVGQTDAPVTLSGTLRWLIIWTGGLVFCALLAASLVAIHVNPVIGGALGGLIAVAAIICLYAVIMLISGYFHWRRVHRKFSSHDVPDINAALNDGRVAVKKVTASAVIEIEEFEDEGAGYIFNVGNGMILFLKGQRFFPIHDDMEWPNCEFEIIRTVHGDRWVGVFCLGRRLEPVRTIPTAECKDDIVWADREDILDGDIDSFVKSLLKVA